MELVLVLFRFMDTDSRVTHEAGDYLYYNDKVMQIRADASGIRKLIVRLKDGNKVVLETRGTRVVNYKPGEWEEHVKSIASDAFAAHREENEEQAQNVESRVQEQLQVALSAEPDPVEVLVEDEVAVVAPSFGPSNVDTTNESKPDELLSAPSPVPAGDDVVEPETTEESQSTEESKADEAPVPVSEAAFGGRRKQPRN